MNLIHVIVLAFVEGVTEFLPVSSTGHLILTTRLLSIPTSDFVKTFEIVIQLGAILAVVCLYWKKFLSGFGFYKNLAIAFLPTAFVGFVIYPLVRQMLGSQVIVVVSLFTGGIAMILFEKYYKNQKNLKVQSLGPKNLLIIGLIQSVSMIPGVSRAMATIYGGRIVGLTRAEATEFSFLLAVPTMLAASVYDLYKSYDVLVNTDYYSIAIGFVGSFLFALLAVKFLINFTKKHDFTVFGVYRIVLAVIFWLWILQDSNL